MATKVTIQDIADALNISRNTVSKAINNTGILADATREKVLKKAQEMGYKQFSYINIADTGKTSSPVPGVEEKHEIALLTGMFLANTHFASTMLDKFQRELAQLGYILSMHSIATQEIEELKLPLSFNKERIAGIVCIEMFDRAYCKMICSLEIPTLFIDTPADGFEEPLPADKLYMDNQTEIYRFIKEMVHRGKKNIGFVGDYMHCHSFYERYMGYRNALYMLGLSCSEEFCILNSRNNEPYPDPDDYRLYLQERLQKMKKLPDVFICANDFAAMDVIYALKELGYSVPQDVWLCGFDDTAESKVITPSLTTIHIHSQVMGLSAVQLLMSRIKEPSLNFRTMYTETNLIYRESTED